MRGSPAIVETFVKTVGSADPLSITVRSGNRIVLVPAAKTPDEALATIRAHAGGAVVRVGITQCPVGIGIQDSPEISPDLLDACSNLRQGMALFGKVWRIVPNWHGNPTEDSVIPQVMKDATEAWETGRFEGEFVFSAPDPGLSDVSKIKDGALEAVPREPSGAPAEMPTISFNEADKRVAQHLECLGLS